MNRGSVSDRVFSEFGDNPSATRMRQRDYSAARSPFIPAVVEARYGTLKLDLPPIQINLAKQQVNVGYPKS